MFRNELIQVTKLASTALYTLAGYRVICGAVVAMCTAQVLGQKKFWQKEIKASRLEMK